MDQAIFLKNGALHLIIKTEVNGILLNDNKESNKLMYFWNNIFKNIFEMYVCPMYFESLLE